MQYRHYSEHKDLDKSHVGVRTQNASLEAHAGEATPALLLQAKQ